ncbi:hypothetical protein [Nonomuraea sp. NEAU-A123]|uniref:hypothetical protein n=1 Tax=Nonomuraea sp. NEAU-A123 TaxID=2839649 RepID=UPI001BE4CB4B|nr:hypothetical protein [Nonomuraea sp. NEAU-A123]MBT2225016.1 hypothetical protein [Nonomuraea sp. NEAU-A123]
MLAIIAAIIFGLGLLFDLLNVSLAGLDGVFFVLLGLCLLALHQAGIGTASLRTGWRRRRS